MFVTETMTVAEDQAVLQTTGEANRRNCSLMMYVEA
jgi:hypothetical protein